MTQDPNPHQTDIDSVIHQDDTETPENSIAIVANGSGNGRGRAVVKGSAPTNGQRKSLRLNNAPGLTIERRFTKPGEDVYSTVEWELRDAVITNERGEKVFEQKDVEIPKSWTQLATNVVVSKYFRGHLGTPQRERSVRQLIGRVANTMADWGRAMDYFATEADAQAFQDELTHILLHQKAAFNSPVWFNVGLPDQPHPQGSACFINSVEDTMDSILTLAKTEGMLFKYGSGTGTNLSPIRGSREPLQGGGTASGPISFMRGFDAFASAIKSGGKTRRAAKMVILDIDHPDIEEFITCKEKEERKAWALIDAGYSGMFNVPGGAYDSVSFQNANHSVRVTDEFMRAYEQDADWNTRFVLSKEVAGTYKARDLMRMMGQSAWVCGDPGVQYDTTINKWHTCKNTDKIYASNPCCVTGDTLIAVANGRNAVAIKDLAGTEVPVYAHDLATGNTTVSRMWNIGVKRQNAPVYRVTLDDGSEFRATDDHLIMLRDGSFRMVRDLRTGDSLMPFHSKVLAPAKTRTKRRYYWSGRSWQPQYRAVWKYFDGIPPQGYHIHHRDFNALNDTVDNLVLMPAEEHNALHGDLMRGDNNPARRFMSAEWRQHIAEAMQGERNANYGRKHSEEARRLMREKSALRWAKMEERERSGESIRAALAKTKAEGRSVGRPRGERYERCCPVCRSNFITARIEQVFCSVDCRYSPMGRQMCDEKTASQNRGRSLSASHRAKLSMSVSAASDPETKRRAALTSHRNTILKAARVLLDNDIMISLDTWDVMRSKARALGAARVPTAKTVAQHLANDSALREEARLFNHKVVSVEFCGYEDVYDGTVDTHHNFAILTSAETACVESALNYSGVFVHNSEYMFLNDSACNLASLNLMRFRREDGEFDPEAFRHACRILITAQEIIVDNASYPTPRIAENSHDYRPLGLGYANLGALLMARGLPYDSDAGRAYAAAITALMTGEAYHQSSIIARNHGWPFPGYAKNREPFLEVMRMHRAAVDDIAAAHVPDDLLSAARQSWDNAVASGENYGYRNAQATVIAPTGTISFLMDADTTGIEPDIAIVKYKNLVGGGVMKIVNNTVPEALQRLGYSPAQVERILAYIDEHDTIEGAPDLKPEHLPVFDCAFKPGNGTRSIHYMGHVRMMAAAQPFISGAISKCVTGETLLYTEKGIVPIKKFYEGEKPGNFSPCALTLGSISAPQAADLFYYGGVRPTIRLTLADGRTIEGTPNHRIKVANAQGYDWKRLDEITPDDYAAIRLGTDVWASENARIEFQPGKLYGYQKAVRIPERMTPELGRFLGYYIAEGNMTRSNWMVRITNNNAEVLRRCQETVRSQFGLEGRIETDARNGVQSYVVVSKTLVELLTYLGCAGTSGQKTIPWAVLQSRKEVVQEFVAGLWLDGYVGQGGRVAICLNSEPLIRQLQVVLNNFGLRAQILRKYNKEYAKHFWELGLYGSMVRQFAALFPLDDAHKTQRLQEICGQAKQTETVYSDVVPCYRDAIRAAIYRAHDTTQWRHVFGKRTRHLSWQTVRAAYAQFRLPELAEIVENDIHFVGVKEVAYGFAEVYDFQVPENHAFIGNGIVNHNTVNMPNEATPEEIVGTYVEGWKLGLKAIAIYRDGSKRTQPLMTKKAEPVETQAVEVPTPAPATVPAVVEERRPMRRKLPDERRSITHKFSIAGHEGYITVGMYEDGTPGEIFLTMSKEGSTISGLMDSFATAISLALQYGVPLQTLVDKFGHTRFEPSGITNNPDIRFAKSIMDYIFRWLGAKFLNRQPVGEPSLSNGHTEEAALDSGLAVERPQLTLTTADTSGDRILSLTERERETFQNQADAPICTECGSLMVRNGACYKCLNCGSVFGCS